MAQPAFSVADVGKRLRISPSGATTCGDEPRAVEWRDAVRVLAVGGKADARAEGATIVSVEPRVKGRVLLDDGRSFQNPYAGSSSSGCSPSSGPVLKRSGSSVLTHEYRKGEAEVSEELEAQLRAFFDKMDWDGDGNVTQEEAEKHCTKFPKVSAQSMFNEVDEDGNKEVSWDEFLAFWKNVVASREYSTEDLMEEVGDMINGESWVDFNDGRTT
jgi:hypothetical protein